MSKILKVSIPIIVSIVITTVLCILGYFYMPICPDVDKRINRTTEFELFLVPISSERTGLHLDKYILVNSKEINNSQKQLVICLIKNSCALDSITENIHNQYVNLSSNGFAQIEYENGATFFINDIDATYLNHKTMEDFNIEYKLDFQKWHEKIYTSLRKDFCGITDEEFYSHIPNRP